MNLLSLKIDGYKNLQDLSIELDNQSQIETFVGKNGSGKSNLLEALLIVFDHIDNYDNRSLSR